jgi:hypothetical protein
MKWFAWSRRSCPDDLSEEIQSHIEEKTDALIATGLPRADAEREARRAFGNVTQVKEAAGDVWRLESHIDSFGRDTRHALRGLVQKPGYAVAVVLTLALGIGANAVVFALVNALVLRPLPYPDSDRIISISQAGRDGPRRPRVERAPICGLDANDADGGRVLGVRRGSSRRQHTGRADPHHRTRRDAPVLRHLRRPAAHGTHLR